MPKESDNPRIRELARQSRWLLVEAVCLGNFLSFWLVGVLIGGSAILGGIHGGHYFIGDHGHVREVPFSLWLYSWTHTLSQVVTFPIGIVAALRHRLAEKQERLRGRGAV